MVPSIPPSSVSRNATRIMFNDSMGTIQSSRSGINFDNNGINFNASSDDCRNNDTVMSTRWEGNGGDITVVGINRDGDNDSKNKLGSKSACNKDKFCNNNGGDSGGSKDESSKEEGRNYSIINNYRSDMSINFLRTSQIMI